MKTLVEVFAAANGVPATVGKLRTVHGVRVIEVHSGYYISLDMKREAYHHTRRDGAAFNGWIVSSRNRRQYSDVITTKQAALRYLATTTEDE